MYSMQRQLAVECVIVLEVFLYWGESGNYTAVINQTIVDNASDFLISLTCEGSRKSSI